MSSKKLMVSPYTRKQCSVMHLFYLNDIREIKLNEVFHDRAAVNASMALYCSVNRHVMMCGYVPMTSSALRYPRKWVDICYTCADETCPARCYFTRTKDGEMFQLTQMLEHTCTPNYRRKPHCFGKLLGTLFAPEYFKQLSITRRDARAVLRSWRMRGIAINIPQEYDILHGMIHLFRHTKYLVDYIKQIGIERFNEMLENGWDIPKSVSYLNGVDYTLIPSYWPKNPDRVVAPDERSPPRFNPCSDSSESFEPTDELKFSGASDTIGPLCISNFSTSDDSEDSSCEDTSLRTRRDEPDETTTTSGLKRVDGGTRETKAPRLELPEFLSKEQTRRTSEETVEQKASHEDNE